MFKIDLDRIHPDDKAKFEERHICLICREIPTDIKSCSKCMRLYCKECIMDWYKTNPTCPNKCSTEPMTIKDLSPEDLAKDEKVRFRCGNCCEEYFYHAEYMKHVSVSKLKLCDNNCGAKAPFTFDDKEFCSYKCYNDIFFKGGVDKKRESQFPFYFDYPNNESFKMNSNNQISHVDVGSTPEEAHFDTIINRIGFLNCYHKLVAKVAKSDWPFKIGFTNDPSSEKVNASFCDFESGFGFYTIGQTRNESDMSGLPYGEKLDNSKPLSITSEFNILDGKLQFWNGSNCFGQMFDGEYEEPFLKNGPFYFALSARKNLEGLELNYI
jgi:hypothetical protein